MEAKQAGAAPTYTVHLTSPRSPCDHRWSKIAMGRPLPKQGDQLAKAYHNNPVSRQMQTEEMMVKITAPGTQKGYKAALDIVVVLDISGSMQGKKLQDMKEAMMFLIEKLGKHDRLAIVPFNSSVGQRYPGYSLRAMTDKNEADNAIKFIQRMQASGCTNIKEGLKAGINILVKERMEMTKRASCIFLMSDGVENIHQARDLLDDVANVTVHTFGFGKKSNEELLFDIACKSHIGIYHHVREMDSTNDLMESFSSLAIFRSISMLGLKVTLIPEEDIKIQKVDPCLYNFKAQPNGSWTIDFGDLAREENRRLLVDVRLPTVHQDQKGKNILKVEYSYSAPYSMITPGPALDVKVNRVRNPRIEATNPDVKREVVRRRQVEYLKTVKDFANAGKLSEARVEVDKARNEVNTLGPDKDDAVDALHRELDNLLAFLDTNTIYKELGRSYLLACICSHQRQRYAARGGAVHIGFYLTTRMEKYLNQARAANRNSKKR